MEIDILLRRDVLVHILVHIQMVRRKVRHHRDVRRALHIKQLERRELDDREVFRLHLLRVAQQRVADVAAEIHGFPRRAQHFGDNARRGGLAVAARQTSKKISISDVTMLPRAFASSSAGTSGRMPGVRKTTSARRSSR